jgi:hypothetical protein
MVLGTGREWFSGLVKEAWMSIPWVWLSVFSNFWVVDLFVPHQFVTIISRATRTSTTICEMVKCKVKVNPHPPMHHTRETFADTKHLSTLFLFHNEPSMYIIYLLTSHYMPHVLPYDTYAPITLGVQDSSVKSANTKLAI